MPGGEMPEKEENRFIRKIEDLEFIDDKEHIRYLLSKTFPELKEKYDQNIDPLVAALEQLEKES